MAQIKWKTKAEIEEEKNKPKEPSIEEYLIDLDFRLSMIKLGLV